MAQRRRDGLRQVEREDLARERHLKQFFGKDIDGPLLYHVVLNTDPISADDSVRTIALAITPKTIALPAFLNQS